MKTSSYVGAAVVSLLLISSSAPAATLGYAWRNGEVRRYRYEETTHFHRGGETVTIRSTFSQRVRMARRDGTAQMEFALEQLQVVLGDEVIDVLGRLPPEAAALGATADRQGRLTLERKPTLSLRDGRIDVALGTPNAGADQSVPTLDALPWRLFELLVLPRRAPAAGKTRKVRGPAGALRWSLATSESSVSTMRVTTAAASDDLQARQRMGLSTRATLIRPREADLTMRFDRAKGQLLEARGTVIEWRPSKTNSRFVLEVASRR
jgi:hypothetical protein